MEKSKKEQKFFKTLFEKLGEYSIEDIVTMNKSLNDTLISIAASEDEGLFWLDELYGLVTLKGIISEAISDTLLSLIYKEEKAPEEAKLTEAVN